MTARPFGDLPDAQVSLLRQLIDAALAANPDLATGAALVLATEARVEQQRRRASVPSFMVGAAAPLLSPAALAPALAEAVARVRPEATSTTKWSPVAVLVARALGLSETSVYVTSVGGLSRNIAVRLAQSKRARDATVAVIIWAPGAEPLSHAVAAAARACADTPRLTLVCTLADRGVDLQAIVVPPSFPAHAALTLAYPNAGVVVAGAGQSPSDD